MGLTEGWRGKTKELVHLGKERVEASQSEKGRMET